MRETGRRGCVRRARPTGDKSRARSVLEVNPALLGLMSEAFSFTVISVTVEIQLISIMHRVSTVSAALLIRG